MITTPEQYNAYLHVIYNNNPPVYATLPTADNIYNIDLKTRKVEAPPFLAVEKDNISETIYFIVDRYADFMDLATTSCIITYVNTSGFTRFYSVPFYDIYSYAKENKMIIPWNISRSVTDTPGPIEFTIQFFKTVQEYNSETRQNEIVISYSLNTLAAKSKILAGLSKAEIDQDTYLIPTEYEILTNRIVELETIVEQKSLPFWTILESN